MDVDGVDDTCGFDGGGVGLNEGRFCVIDVFVGSTVDVDGVDDTCGFDVLAAEPRFA